MAHKPEGDHAGGQGIAFGPRRMGEDERAERTRARRVSGKEARRQGPGEYRDHLGKRDGGQVRG